MAVVVGADGAFKLDLGDGEIYVSNVFTWEARLSRSMLRQTTVADNHEKRTGGLGDWSGSFSFRLEFSDDTSQALSAWQVLNHATSATGDDLKAEVKLVLQRYGVLEACDLFDSHIGGVICLVGTVVIGDVSLDCSDPEQPIVAVVNWSGDGALALERGQ
jgi:hypothetical protein